METTTDDFIDIQPGASVYGADGEKLGAIMEIGPDYIVVEKGLFFPTDYFVPNSAIATVEPERITLTLSRDKALDQGWDKDPTEHSDAPADREEPPVQRDLGSGNEDRQPVTGFAARTDGTLDDENASAGLATELGTVPPAADFQTLGEAPIDVNSDYARGNARPAMAGSSEGTANDERPDDQRDENDRPAPTPA